MDLFINDVMDVSFVNNYGLDSTISYVDANYVTIRWIEVFLVYNNSINSRMPAPVKANKNYGIMVLVVLVMVNCIPIY